MTDLHYLTIREASNLIRSKKLSPVELTQAFLDRIQVVNGKVKAYVTLTADSALAQARAAETAIQRGNYLGPMHGIPIALKDLYDTKGVRTTAQSKVLEHRVPTEDATATAMLKGAGSVLLGKLAMSEFALGGPPTSLFEQARNPWNLDHVTGGSSTGCGAAVAAGLCMGSLGSDTSGSIRGPASLCGIVGLRPTYGRVSRYGVIPLSWSLDACGPMTWTVGDTAIMLQAIAGHDPKDPTSSREPVPDYSASLAEDIRGVKIGVPRHYFFDPESGLAPETQSAVEKALSDLEAMGAQVQEVTVPSLDLASIANYLIDVGEAFAYHRKNLKAQPQNYGESIRLRLYVGALFTAHDYIQAMRVRSRVKRELALALEQVDVIATPTSRNSAATFAEEASREPWHWLTRSFTGPFSQTGSPAISVPCGFSSTGLPIGLQVVGRPFDEPTVLRVAYAYQQQAGWYKKRPSI